MKKKKKKEEKSNTIMLLCTSIRNQELGHITAHENDGERGAPAMDQAPGTEQLERSQTPTQISERRSAAPRWQPRL